MSDSSPPIGRIVSASVHRPWLVIGLATVLALLALVYAGRHFAMTTDTAELISTRLEWRQRELAFEAAFPQLQKLDIVVVDGATPELAEASAARLAKELAKKPELFRSVRRADGGPFFDRNGLLLLGLDEVKAATEGLVRAQAFLAPLAADPSLRGVMSSLAGILEGIRQGRGTLAGAEPAMRQLADSFDGAMAGKPVFFSWRRLVGGPPTGMRDTRRILVVQPVMDFTALQPGAAASDAIRATAHALGLDQAHGTTVRLTGSVPLTDEEFVTLAQDADLVAGAMVVALLGILWLAVRSVRVVAAILVTTLFGLVMTAGLGLLVTGRFNLISVAFIPLFVGLGIDFSIQLSVRYLAERFIHPTHAAALTAAGDSVGKPLALAAIAIGVGFFAFLPTSYIGVAELGAIAGLGMIIALGLCVTLLPALLVLLRPAPVRAIEDGYGVLAPVEDFLVRHRRAVLGLGLASAVGSAALLALVRFDFDPLHLKSPKVESMATLHDLAADAIWTPNTITVLLPAGDGVAALQRRLVALPEVARTVSLESFVPSQQAEKLALIKGAAAYLDPILGATPRPPPSDAEVVQSLALAETALQSAAPAATGSAADAARRLAGALGRLRTALPEVRAAAASTVIVPLGVVLSQIRASLQAAPITLAGLPADIVAEWTTRDGRARIQVFPRAGQGDEQALERFATAIQHVAPDATGTPISIRAAGGSIVEAFLQAGVYSALAIVVLLAVAMRRMRDVMLTMVPVLLSGLLTFASCAALDLPLNFTNIIALPLLFGIGVAFNIYFVVAWRAGEIAMLQSSLMRAVVFSALTTATAFGALWLSSHPGTASMGRLLMISLAWEILITLLFRPALLARPPAKQGSAQ